MCLALALLQRCHPQPSSSLWCFSQTSLQGSELQPASLEPGSLRVTIQTELAHLRQLPPGNCSCRQRSSPPCEVVRVGRLGLSFATVMMHHSNLFCPQPETYGLRPLDRLDAPPTRPFPAFVVPENLASVGTPSLYNPGNPEKELFATPPAGFHMAPCGCFFDPRIYRIEWATTNTVQPPVYKLSPQKAYLLDGQKYLKNPITPGPYPAYQGVGNNPQFIVPFFKAEGPPAAPGMDGFVAPPGLAPQIMDVVRFPSEDLAPSEEHGFPEAGPESNPKEQSTKPPEAYEALRGQPERGQVAAFQADEERELHKSDATQRSVQRVATAGVQCEDPAPLGVPGAEITADVQASLDRERPFPDGNTLLGEQAEPLSLPDEVLLEVAMKLFDCSPLNSDTEASLDDPSDGGRNHPCPEDSLTDRGLSGQDSPSDIRSLNLPDELLSFDYSVPEILGAVTSLDYLYDMNTFGAGSQWECRPPCLPSAPKPLPPGTESEEEETEQNKPVASITKPALTQGGNREELELAELLAKWP